MNEISSRTFYLAESPRYLDDAVFFTDINEGKLYCWDKNGVKAIWDKEAVTSFVFDENGAIVFATMHGLYYMKKNGDYSLLIPNLKINDMTADPSGRVVFGTNYHSKDRSFPLGTLYSYSIKEGLHELDYGYYLANGIGFSKDGKKMYVCDSAIHTIFEYDYDVENGSCGKKRILVRFLLADGIPDGMAIDDEGRIWTAQWYGRCVICTSPDGEEVTRIKVPEAQVSAVEFTPQGLFVTTSGVRGRMDVAPADFSSSDPDIYGKVYLADVGTTGRPHAKSNIYKGFHVDNNSDAETQAVLKVRMK